MDKITIPWTILTAIIGASSALIGVLISNNAQERRLKLQFAHEEKSKSIQLKKSKLEELFVLYEKWEKDIACIYLMHIPVFKGDYTWEHARELSTKDMLQEKGEHQRFQAILHLHFSSLKPAFDEVFEKRRIVLRYCKEPDTSNTPVTYKAFIKSQEEFEQESLKFKDQMCQLASEL